MEAYTKINRVVVTAGLALSLTLLAAVPVAANASTPTKTNKMVLAMDNGMTGERHVWTKWQPFEKKWSKRCLVNMMDTPVRCEKMKHHKHHRHHHRHHTNRC